MASTSSPPDFGPVPSPRPPSTSQDQLTADKLSYLRRTDRLTNHPTSWGFTLYRAAFGPGTDERFAEALRRLRVWVQWHTKQSRYRGSLTDSDIRSAGVPALGTPHDTDELARRFWIEVVEDYLDRDAVRCGLEVKKGSEDFSPIGRAFIIWVRENGKNIDQLEHDDFDADEPELYVRNDHCLIIDERALAALETLPEYPPAGKPLLFEEWDMCFSTYQNAWLWILDRKTMRAQELGRPPVRCSWMEPDHPSFPPWCRINTMYLFNLWFGRPDGYCVSDWAGVVAESRAGEEWGKVRYWDQASTVINETIADWRKMPLEQELALEIDDEHLEYAENI